MQLTTSASDLWVPEPWEKRQYTTGEWGIVHVDPAGDVQHVAIGVDVNTADLLLAAPAFYRAAQARQAVADHLGQHAACTQHSTGAGGTPPCVPYIMAQATAAELLRQAMHIAEGKLATPSGPPIPDPRQTAPTPRNPSDAAFQTSRIFNVPGGAGGRRDLIDTFIAETGASIEGVTAEPPPSNGPMQPATPATPATPEPRAPLDHDPTDYEQVDVLETRPPTAAEHAWLDSLAVPGRPLLVVERGDHQPMNTAQRDFIAERVAGGSVDGIGVRDGDTLRYYRWEEPRPGSTGGVTWETIATIDPAGEDRCTHCRALPLPYLHMPFCPLDTA